jgi:hypothetical protein
MPLYSKVKTQSNSHHFAIVVFPWQYEWADSPICSGDEVFNEYDPEVLSSSNPDIASRVIHISHQKRKELISGTLTVDFISKLPKSGSIPGEGAVESRINSLGNWIILLTSSNGPVGSTYKEVVDAYTSGAAILQFIGQVSSVHSSYFADASGAMRQTNKITSKDWSFVFDAPAQLHKWNTSVNTKLESRGPAGMSIVEEEIHNWTTKGKGYDKLSSLTSSGLLMMSAFLRPFITMIFMGMYKDSFWNSAQISGVVPSKKTDNTNSLKEIGDAASPFDKILARLPALPQNLITFLAGNASLAHTYDKEADTKLGLFGKDKSKSYTEAWYKSFMGFISGVQDWKNSKAPKCLPNGVLLVNDNQVQKTEDWHPLTKFTQGWTDVNAKRPLAPFSQTVITAGSSARQQIEDAAEGVGMCECYSELIQIKGEGGQHRALPALVMRDVPFSMKQYTVNKEASTSKDIKVIEKKTAVDAVPWTYYEDLPFVRIYPESIVSFDHVSEIDGTSNYIVFNPNMAMYRESVNKATEVVLGTSINLENQYRFGAMRRIFDGGATLMEAQTTGGVKLPGAPSASASDGKTVDISTEWFTSFREKFSEIYSTTYRFGSGTLKIKDNNYRISVGNNLHFELRDQEGWVYCGHVRGIDRRYTIGEGGTVMCTLLVHLTRICVLLNDVDGVSSPEPQLCAFPMFYLKSEMYNKKSIPRYTDMAVSRKAEPMITKIDKPEPEKPASPVTDTTDEKPRAEPNKPTEKTAVLCSVITKPLKDATGVDTWEDLPKSVQDVLKVKKIGDAKDIIWTNGMIEKIKRALFYALKSNTKVNAQFPFLWDEYDSKNGSELTGALHTWQDLYKKTQEETGSSVYKADTKAKLVAWIQSRKKNPIKNLEKANIEAQRIIDSFVDGGLGYGTYTLLMSCGT